MSIKNFFRKINGTVTTRHENGERKEVAEYRLWRRHGRTSYFTERGRLLQEAGYRHGKLHGEYCAYDDYRGQILEHTQWANGKENGWSTCWDTHGNIIERCRYENGKVVERVEV